MKGSRLQFCTEAWLLREKGTKRRHNVTSKVSMAFHRYRFLSRSPNEIGSFPTGIQLSAEVEISRAKFEIILLPVCSRNSSFECQCSYVRNYLRALLGYMERANWLCMHRSTLITIHPYWHELTRGSIDRPLPISPYRVHNVKLTDFTYTIDPADRSFTRSFKNLIKDRRRRRDGNVDGLRYDANRDSRVHVIESILGFDTINT